MNQHLRASLTVGIALAGGLLASTVNAETVLRWNNWLPPGHSQLVGVMQPWFKQVEEATKGRVKIVPTDSSLGAPPRQFDLAVDGVADVVLAIAGYTPGRFKLITVAELPGISQSGEARATALWKVYQKYFEKSDEFKGVKLLGIYSGSPGSLMTKGAPVLNANDWKGKKIRVGGGMMNDVNEALGGVNVARPAGEIFELLSSGVIDGAFMGGEGYDSFKLKGLVKYVTMVPKGMYGSVWFVAMNQGAFDKLSKEDQAALMSVSGEAIAKLGGSVFDEAELVGRKHLVEDGVKVTWADGDFLKAIQEKTAFLKDRWLADAKAMGVDGNAALKEYLDAATAADAASAKKWQ